MSAPHPIPDAALETDIAILGKKGRGKSYTARGIVERLLASGRRVIVLDPLSTWWGLKAGKGSFPVPVIGGPHADVPLDVAAIGEQGAALGRYLAGAAGSAVIDLGSLRKAELVRFARPFLEELYTINRDPLWLVLEEADVFAPQQPQPDTAPLLGEVDRIARRGRAFGFRLISLTQRPAKLHKDVLTQLSTLVALGITSPQDRDAIKAWVEGAGDRDKAKEVLDTLASLKVGEGWVWAPDQELLERVTFPPIRTLDTSATPKAGEARPDAKLRADVDVVGLRETLAHSSASSDEAKRDTTVAQDGKQPKPKNGANRQLAESQASAVEIAAAEQRGFARGQEEGLRRGAAAGWRAATELFQIELGSFASLLPDNPGEHEVGEEHVAKALGLAAWPSANEPLPSAAVDPLPDQRTPAPASARATAPVPAANGKLGPERRILAVLAGAYPAGMTEPQWAVAAGMKRSGGSWSTYKSRLRVAGAIETRDGQWFVTATGLDLVGAAVKTMPPPGPELVEFWITRIASVGPMLRALAKRYPRGFERGELANEIGMTASGGSFSTYLSRLRSAGLIEQEGSEIRAAPALMERTARDAGLKEGRL